MFGSWSRELDEGEEAVVKVGAFYDEMGEEIIGVPQEEKIVSSRSARWQDAGGEQLGSWHEGESDGKGESGASIQGEWRRACHCCRGSHVGKEEGERRAGKG